MDPSVFISPKECLRIMSRFLNNPVINDVKIESLHGIVTGMMGEYYKITICASNENLTLTKSFFLKIGTGLFHSVQETMVKIQGAFEKEEFVYEYIIDKCSRISGCETDFAARCYLTNRVNKSLLLDDLISMGYRRATLEESTNVEQCRLAMKATAQFHACTIVYENKFDRNLYKINPNVFEDSLFRKHEEYLGRKWFKNCLRAIQRIVDLTSLDSQTKSNLKTKLLSEADKIYAHVGRSAKYRNVCCHGDLSRTNVLYKYSGNTPIDCKLVDYQALRYCPPAHDVLNLIYLKTDSAFRKQHMNQLLLYYHQELDKSLAGCELKIEDHVPWNEFQESCRELLSQAVVQTACYHTMNAVDMFPDIEKDRDLYEHFVYTDRSPECVECYRKNEIFASKMDEILEELFSL